MNRFVLEGVIKTIKYLKDSVLVYVDDMEIGYMKEDGTRVDDIMHTWKVIFKNNPFKSYITRYFNEGTLVEIDAKMRPFGIVNGEITEGYSCIGLSINKGCYVRSSFRKEKMAIKKGEAMESVMGMPNVEEFNKSDF